MTTAAVAPVALFERRSPGIVAVTLNRPEARNALNSALVDRLQDLFSALAVDHELRAVILSGAGGCAFSAGADLRERQKLPPEQRAQHTESVNQLIEVVAAFPVPVIAAINGYALAGGLELALACDLRVAANNAVFGLPEVKIGIFPGAGGLVRLPRLVGPSVAKDLIFTGRHVPAEEAFDFGLIDRMVEPNETMETAILLAEMIAQNAPLAVRAAKQALWESEGLPERSAQRVVQRRRRSLDASRDYSEGLSAFAERRIPRFTGK